MAAEALPDQGASAAPLRRGKVERRPVLVALSGADCPACGEMDRLVYERPQTVQEIARSVVFLRRQVDDGEGAKLAAEHHVFALPTLLLLDSAGQEIERWTGFVDGALLVAHLGELRAGRNTLALLERRLAALPVGARPPELLFEVMRRHALKGDPRAPEELEALVAAAGRSPLVAEALLILARYFYQGGRKDHVAACATLERLVSLQPTTAAAKRAPYYLAISRHHLGDDAGALRTLEDWLAGEGRDLDRYNGFAWSALRLGLAPSRAIAVAREGLVAFPDAHALWDTLAQLLAARGDHPEALAAARKALDLKPDDRGYAALVARLEKAQSTP